MRPGVRLNNDNAQITSHIQSNNSKSQQFAATPLLPALLVQRLFAVALYNSLHFVDFDRRRRRHLYQL